jgi:hypothetical protein
MKNIFPVIILILLISCKKEATRQGAQGPKGATGDKGADEQIQTGTISGRVSQLLSNVQPADNVTVSLRDYTNTTVTDAQGNYTLTNVPAGVQEVVFSKSGFAVLRLQQLILLGNANLRAHGQLFPKADFEFTGGYINDTLGASFLNFRVYLPVAGSFSKAVAVLVSEVAVIDPEDPRTYGYSYFASANGSVLAQSVPLRTNGISEIIMTPGKTLYANIYPYVYVNAPGAQSVYPDLEGIKNAAPACGKPIGNTISFVIP